MATGVSVDRLAGSDGDSPAADEHHIREWALALRRTSHLALSNEELIGKLRELSDLLSGLLTAETCYEDGARWLGAELVRLNATAPEALASTLELIGGPLPPAAQRVEHGRRGRVQGGVAAGFVAELRARVLDEQESLRMSMVHALERAESDRHASAARFAAIFSQTTVGVSITDTSGNTLKVNRSMADLLGYTPEDLLAVSLEEFFYDDEPDEPWQVYQQLIAGEIDHHAMEKRFRRPDGDVVWAHVSASVIRDSRGEPEFLVFLASDITERYQLAQRLRHQATHDPLTGLANRSLFHEQLRRAFTDGAGG
ncbi:MAG: PAS domain S-box protein, partial [Pseudonocardiaceae bacterium]|nr:PAS domain S-box protein [Pseudonocardiaceae bacterium]